MHLIVLQLVLRAGKDAGFVEYAYLAPKHLKKQFLEITADTVRPIVSSLTTSCHRAITLTLLHSIIDGTGCAVANHIPLRRAHCTRRRQPNVWYARAHQASSDFEIVFPSHSVTLPTHRHTHHHTRTPHPPTFVKYLLNLLLQLGRCRS
jgi:hypothetical protein